METRLIEHWSYSAMTLFMRNKLAFKKRYILKIYDDSISPTALVGRAAHKTMEILLGATKGQNFDIAIRKNLDVAIQQGQAHLDTYPDNQIDWGKTGSREKVVKTFHQVVRSYIEELPRGLTTLGVEQKITAFIEIGGKQHTMPAKSVQDWIAENKQRELEGLDHKFVSSYSDPDLENPAHIIQAMFAWHTVKAEYGRELKRFRFRECKTSTNSDGSPQTREYVIEYADHPDYFTFFENIYNDCTNELMRPDLVFLPNFQDMFDGNDSFVTYRDNLITVDVPAEMRVPKIVHREIEEKRFIESAPDRVENTYLTDEERIRLKLQEFGMPVEMGETYRGGSVTLFTCKASRGIPMKKFDASAQDLALALKARSIRVLAPIPGTDMVGIEVPNKDRIMIHYHNEDGSLNPRLNLQEGTLNIPVGVNVYGETITKDLSKMPHLLVAGATGSGKSVMLNVIIRSLVEQNTPDALKLVLIDPKRVELSHFKNLPHLLTAPIYESKKAAVTLDWLVKEMEARYDMLERGGYRDIDARNKGEQDKMHKLVVVIDEFADLILQAGLLDVETNIVRIAQKARAVGIHIIIGTQRPTVDVVTGLIKANLPTRIAFRTTSRTDSQVILDQNGAEQLSGAGDMLFLDPSHGDCQRLQGFYL